MKIVSENVNDNEDDDLQAVDEAFNYNIDDFVFSSSQV